jgi:Phosphotransferase enzyme family
MTFLLGTQNFFTYLVDRGLCNSSDRERASVEPRICKNFNLLVKLSDRRQLLLKQEPHDRTGTSRGELANEWRFYQLLQEFPALSDLRSLVSEAIDCDREHSILVLNYLDRYDDLAEFYNRERRYPPEIAKCLGTSLGDIHNRTFDRQEYRDFLAGNGERKIAKIPNLLTGLARIAPEEFAVVSADGLRFLELYQRYEHLETAIAALNRSFIPCCLTHDDLKLNNILIYQEWEQSTDRSIRIIDWESWRWGDPAADLGALVGSYLKLWLGSFVINTDIDIATALSLAHTPLEVIQPSTHALVVGYLQAFPEILDRDPSFIDRVVRFAGWGLIERIRAALHYYEPLTNREICMLEVAKTLLCDPESSIPTIFGVSTATLTQQVGIA